MDTIVPGNGRAWWRPARAGLRMLALATLVITTSLLADRQASASQALSAAAATANGGLSGCSTSQGRALYGCVADVLDRMAADVSSANVPETQRALQTAASKLRAAVSKSQALSAISQCRALMLAALQKVRATGSAEGWADVGSGGGGGRRMSGGGGPGSGLEAIAGVLNRAAQLIQTRG